MPISKYLKECEQLYISGNATEHSYRPALQKLIKAIISSQSIEVTNEPKRIACGAPDYIITRNELPIGYIEAKDINIDLHHKTLNEQFTRYKSALDNLIITDYLYFEFYRNGIRIAHIRLADALLGKITPHPQKFDEFIQLIQTFIQYEGQKITSPAALASMMANKARMMADVIEKALHQDLHQEEKSELEHYLDGFREHLLHDLDAKKFADLYAQTLAYGMFAARLYDDTPETFDRSEAARLLPKSNPFLRNLFSTIAGERLDSRIVWIVDALADIFRVADIAAILQNFGKDTQTDDPFIHFYETFLAEYDASLRQQNGVWYTPQPAVQFIVRAIDEVLKTHLAIPQGLRDNSKTTIQVETSGGGKYAKAGRKRVSVDKEIHRLQILDPATGTGTFLAEIVRYIHQSYAKQQGLWQNYVEQDLIPRLNGFELMMASYAVAHLKLDLVFQETGFKQPDTPQRFNVFLADSLEEHHPDTNTLFAQWLSNEANAANAVKRDTPVMIVVGNPPYNGSSQNKGDWIMNLMDDYKKEPGSAEKLKERNSKWINNDYIKFLRYGQHYIAKNGNGVLAFINSNSYLDGLIFRGVRFNLLQTYDHIYILDLHGNSKKKETAPDGGKDENVFDITEGVCINIFVKTGAKKKKEQLAQVYHYDLYGKRKDIKYPFLKSHHLNEVAWQTLTPQAPDYFFVPKNTDAGLQAAYLQGIDLNRLFPVNSVGVVTAKDKILISEKKEILLAKVSDFYRIDADNKLAEQINYRPFDNRWIYFDTDKVERSREKVMRHFLGGGNIGLVTKRGGMELQAPPIFIANTISDFRYWSRPGMSGGDYVFPLYLYPENDQADISDGLKRRPNIDPAELQTLLHNTGLVFNPDNQSGDSNSLAPEQLFDYIYAVLHSPAYREQYAEFLKTDFPRIPNPVDKETFNRLVGLGKELRLWHTLTHPDADIVNFITEFDCTNPDMVVDKPRYEQGKVYWNKTAHLKKVPESVWLFYIGGYQPVQKWLKDRKGQSLSSQDLEHLQKMILALHETQKLMQQIDNAI